MGDKHILIADDYLDNITLLREIIVILGHSYAVVENGREAIDKLREEDFDMILMDIEMPGINGIEATQIIRSQFAEPKCQTPIIAISAHSPEHFRDKFKAIGFNDYISKPYTMDKLIDVMNKYIND